ncbi:HAD family hydrolase [Corynebacterium lubricantis]|uniref:HAD-IIB family hydrolase n=1 Tax=Corynebacterium lubricantis TaxID=541095 RepID=UPI00037BEC85|nr:HAD family hydrolase [Corynebacterium lubricantis]
MTVKVAAFDIDGTLRRGGDIAAKDIAAIDAWRNAGHLAISATGRSRSSLSRALHGIDISFDYNVLSNGGAGTTRDDELLFGHPIDSDMVHEAVTEFQDVEGIAVYGTTFGPRDGIFTNNTAIPGVGSSLAQGFIPMTRADITDHQFGVVPLWVPDNPALRVELIERIHTQLPHATYTTNHEFVDIIAPGVNKGKGILQVMELAGIDSFELYTFGDSWNDLPMHEVAHHSHSFTLSPDDVQHATDHVIEHVADALLEYV